MSIAPAFDQGVLRTPASLRAWEVRLAEETFAIVSLPLEPQQPGLPLTEAELDVVRRILRGESNRTISQNRGTSERTVANQIAAIYQKLGLTSRWELAARVSRARKEE